MYTCYLSRAEAEELRVYHSVADKLCNVCSLHNVILNVKDDIQNLNPQIIIHTMIFLGSKASTLSIISHVRLIADCVNYIKKIDIYKDVFVHLIN
jgi:hypothetical protein